MAQGCDAETSLLRHITPDLADMSKAVRTVDETQASEHIWSDLIGSSGV